MVYTANWGIIYPLPPIKGNQKPPLTHLWKQCSMLIRKKLRYKFFPKNPISSSKKMASFRGSGTPCVSYRFNEKSFHLEVSRVVREGFFLQKTQVHSSSVNEGPPLFLQKYLQRLGRAKGLGAWIFMGLHANVLFFFN